MDREDLRELIIRGIGFMNEGSDNLEYLRGQCELGMFLLGETYDNGSLCGEVGVPSV